MAPTIIPIATITLPSPIFIGQPFTFTVTFSNQGYQIGYLPYYDLILDPNIQLTGYTPLATWSTIRDSWLDSDSNPISSYPGYSYIPLPTGPYSNGTQLFNIPVGYSSYGPDQVPLDFNLTATVIDPDFVLGNTYPISSFSIFFLGNAYPVDSSNPEYYVVESPINSYTVTPIIYNIVKTYLNLSGNVNASGPNYPVTFQLDVHLAPNQTITDAQIQDTIDVSMRYISGTTVFVAPTPSLILTTSNPPSIGYYKVPDSSEQNFIFNFGSFTGAPTSGSDLVVQYQVYFDYYDYPSTPPNPLFEVISGSIPDSVIDIPNTATLCNGTTNLDTSNITIPIGPMSLAKSNTLNSGILTYTLTVDISDYFAFENIVISDNLTAGQTFIPSSTTYQVLGNNPVSATPLPISNIVVTAVAPLVDSPPYDPTTNIVFTIPNPTTPYPYYQGAINATISPYPGSINPLETSTAEYPPTQIILTFQTTLDNTYIPTPPVVAPPDNVLSLNDYVSNQAIVQGQNIDPTTGMATTIVYEDNSSSYTLPNLTLTKTIYAVNGIIVVNPPTSLNPMDQLTYRSTMSLPLQNFIDFVWTDYLPPPIIIASNFPNNSPVQPSSSVPPSAWTIQYGPSYSFPLNTATVPEPLLTVDVPSNSISLNFGTVQDTAPNVMVTIDLLYTVVISTNPYPNGVDFTNQANVNFSDVTGSTFNSISPTSVTLNEPDVYIKKGIVTSTNDAANATITTGDISSIYGDVGSTTVNNSSPTFPLTISYFEGFSGGDISELLQGDTVRQVILVANEGNTPAYNVSVNDDPSIYMTLLTPTGIPFGIDQNSNLTSITVVGSVFTFASPIPANTVWAIIYEDQINTSTNVPQLCQSFNNVATLTAFYNEFGDTSVPNDNYVIALNLDRSDTRSLTIDSPSLAFSLLSVTPSGITSGSNMTLGQIANFEVDVTIPPGYSNDFAITANLNLLSFSSQSDPVIPGGITTTGYTSSHTSNSVTWSYGSLTEHNVKSNRNSILTFSHCVSHNRESHQWNECSSDCELQ